MRNNQLVAAINQLAVEKGLPKGVILEAIEAALVSAYKRKYGVPSSYIRARVDPETGDMHIYVEKRVVEQVTDPKVQVSLDEAKAMDPEAEIGSSVLVESPLDNFGRIAAQTAKQVIMQRIREAERESTYEHFAAMEGEIVTGRVQRYNPRTGDVIVALEQRADALLAKEDQLPNERYRRDSRISAYLMEVRKGNRGAIIKLSRTHRNMLRRLLEREVPEIRENIVEIKAIAREPGYRSKVAVAALQPGVEPVGCCVGMRGTRIQNVVNELSGEKIDVIAWSPDTRTFIKNALSPARPIAVLLQEGSNGRTAVVIVPDNQLSLAIGREGQNARLAAKLTGWRIDIKGETEAREEGLIEQAEEQIRLEALAVEEKRKKDLLEAAQAILEGRKPAELEVEAEPTEVPPEGETKPEKEEAVAPGAEEEIAAAEEPEIEVQPAEAAEPAEVEGEVVEVGEPVPAEETAFEPEGLVEEEPEEPVEELEEEEEYELDFEELEELEELEEEEEEEEIEELRKGPKKRKKGKVRKHLQLIYDEELGETIAIRRRKRQRDDWDEYEELA